LGSFSFGFWLQGFKPVLLQFVAGEVQVKEKLLGREILGMLPEVADEAAVTKHGDFMKVINALLAALEPLGLEFVLVDELEPADVLGFLLVPVPESALGDLELFANLGEAYAFDSEFDELLFLVDGMHKEFGGLSLNSTYRTNRTYGCVGACAGGSAGLSFRCVPDSHDPWGQD
jgi:hypothetical protein